MKFIAAGLALLVSALVFPAHAENERKDGVRELIAEMEAAYKNTKTYTAVVSFSSLDRATRKTSPVTMVQRLLFDRDSSGFRLETWHSANWNTEPPRILTVCNGASLWHRDFRPHMARLEGDPTERIDVRKQDAVMETPVEQPARFSALVEQVPVLGKDFVPHLALLLGESFEGELKRLSALFGDSKATNPGSLRIEVIPPPAPPIRRNARE